MKRNLNPERLKPSSWADVKFVFHPHAFKKYGIKTKKPKLVTAARLLKQPTTNH